TAVRGADPTAFLVGPQVLNWDVACQGCGGLASGHAWSDSFLASYQQRYGALPLNAWSLHTYDLDWTHLPLTNAQAAITDLQAARAWLDQRGLSLPLWLSEFGVEWVYDGLQWQQQADGNWKAAPTGPPRQDAVL